MNSISLLASNIKMADKCPTQVKLKLLAFVGSVREGRMGERATKLVQKFYAGKAAESGHTLEVMGNMHVLCLNIYTSISVENTLLIGSCLI